MRMKLFLPLMLLMLALTGCRSEQPKPSTYTLAELQQLPESQLRYPGARVLGQLGYDTQRVLRGMQPANFGYEFGANATAAEISAFYDTQLTALGWQSSPSDVYPSTMDTQVVGWRKGALVVRFAVQKKDDTDPRAPPPEWSAKYQTIYDVVILQDWPKK